MKSTEEYLSILRSEKESLFRKYQISNLGLFGSVARHEQGKIVILIYIKRVLI